jgi:hypothetical protein
MSKLLKLTNTDATFGGNPIVLNADSIITIYPDAIDSSCFVIFTSSEGKATGGNPTKGIGVFVVSGDTHNNFAKEVNSALIAAPSGSVIKLHTKGQIDTFTINQS